MMHVKVQFVIKLMMVYNVMSLIDIVYLNGACDVGVGGNTIRLASRFAMSANGMSKYFQDFVMIHFHKNKTKLDNNKEKESNKAFHLANTGMDDSKQDFNKNIHADEEITSKSVELLMDVALRESVIVATFKLPTNMDMKNIEC